MTHLHEDYDSLNSHFPGKAW